MEVVRAVAAAQAGDVDAFAQLVRAYQDLAMATAYGWLRDRELARDACQEAFADVWRLLGQLDDPRAFPGWFRTIVRKHCDRVTRRPVPVPSSTEPATQVAGAPGPDDVIAEADAARTVRLAVEQLPETERVVVALHYLAECPLPEISRWLDVPLPTVKKRLRSARSRLREGMDEMARETMRSLRPSNDGSFSETVRIFVSLRQGDVDAVTAMVRRNPALLEAVEAWDAELVRERVLPFPARGTLLVRAIERGDEAMVQTLLDLGADPNGPCGCLTAEPPLWTATVTGNLPLVERLLSAGADPDRPAAGGVTPMHVAAGRGRGELVRALVAAGADRDRRDDRGRTPIDVARRNGHHAIVSLLDADGVVGAASPAVAASRRVEWGVKVLDLLAPIDRGARLLVCGHAQVGQAVLLAELAARYLHRPRSAVVFGGHPPPPLDRRDLLGLLAESGLERRVEVAIDDRGPGAPLERMVDTAIADCERGVDVLLVLLSDGAHDADVDAATRRLARRDGSDGVTVVVVRPFLDARPPLPPNSAPWDAQLAFDARLASRGLFPAIDLTATWSRTAVEPRRRRLAAAVRELVDRTRVLDEPAGVDDPDGQRAERIVHYLSQPFLTTEPFSGVPGAWVRVDEMLDDVEALLAGAVDRVPPAELSYLGSLNRRD